MNSRKSALYLQPRDLSLLRDLFESRVMTSAHAAALHFDGSRDAAKKRLQKLKSAGYISERSRRSTEPAVLFLTAKAFSHLRTEGVLAQYPALSARSLEKRARVSDITLRHELEVMDVKAGFHQTARKTQNTAVAEFSTWPALHQFEVSYDGFRETLVKPDGFIRVHEKDSDGISEHTFFLEVDRSSETLDTLVSRAACYLQYYRSGGFAVKSGATPADFKEYPFRVLIVCKSAERRNNTALRLIQSNPPIFTQAYLTTLREAMADPFGCVWLAPAAYRDAIKGTPFGTERTPTMQSYRSQPEREAFVEKNAVKCPLLS